MLKRLYLIVNLEGHLYHLFKYFLYVISISRSTTKMAIMQRVLSNPDIKPFFPESIIAPKQANAQEKVITRLVKSSSVMKRS